MPLPAHRSSRTLLFLCLMPLAPLARGSLWESNGWQLTDILAGSTGYNSNLTLSHDGPGDEFLIVNPTVTLARRNSSTQLQLTGGATQTEFLHNRQPSETDLNFDAIYAYPNADNVIPIYRVEATWLRTSQPESFLGERVQNQQLTITGTGFLPLTGKLGLRGTADYASIRYNSASLNDDQRADAFVGLAYQRNPQNEISINVGSALGTSTPNSAGAGNSDVHSREYYVIGKITGEITPKITGDANIGLGWVDYSGAFTNHISLPLGGADLTWAIDPLRTMTLNASSAATYAPDGSIAEITSASLSFSDQIADNWECSVSAGPTHSSYSREVHQRTDLAWAFGTEFAYQPSVRFRIYLDVDYTDQRSDLNDFTYGQDIISLGSAYRF